VHGQFDVTERAELCPEHLKARGGMCFGRDRVTKNEFDSGSLPSESNASFQSLRV